MLGMLLDVSSWLWLWTHHWTPKQFHTIPMTDTVRAVDSQCDHGWRILPAFACDWVSWIFKIFAIKR